tara:strand:- start:78 stop:539 length:462 start_codon:yes stop_codon:yes gene_type:complete
MSDEQQMTIIENLSEELGEKELRIMALEKEVEEQKKQKLEYLDMCELINYKMNHFVDMADSGNAEQCWCPEWLIDNELGQIGEAYPYDTPISEILIKVILHYFGGTRMKNEDVFEEYKCLNGGEYDDFCEMIEDNEGKIIIVSQEECWVSDDL